VTRKPHTKWPVRYNRRPLVRPIDGSSAPSPHSVSGRAAGSDCQLRCRDLDAPSVNFENMPIAAMPCTLPILEIIRGPQSMRGRAHRTSAPPGPRLPSRPCVSVIMLHSSPS
jgi:hypothetical protein